MFSLLLWLFLLPAVKVKEKENFKPTLRHNYRQVAVVDEKRDVFFNHLAYLIRYTCLKGNYFTSGCELLSPFHTSGLECGLKLL